MCWLHFSNYKSKVLILTQLQLSLAKSKGHSHTSRGLQKYLYLMNLSDIVALQPQISMSLIETLCDRLTQSDT